MNEISKTKAPETKPLASPMPSKHSFKPLKACTTLEEAFQTHEFMERIQSSVPQHVSPSRMLRTFVSAVSKTPLLAQADLRTYLGACLTCSQVGLEPNTPLGHIWLLPFKAKRWNPQTKRRDIESVEVNVIFGYPGLLDLSFRTTQVKAIHADVVWPGDEFSFEYGSDAHLKHRPRGHKDTDRPIYAYMHATLRDGQAFEVMPYDDVLRIRDRSQAFRYALSAKEDAEGNGRRLPSAWTEAPWVAHEIPMARKTAFRSGSKWLPRSVELASAISLDERQELRRGINFASVMDAPTIDGTPDYLAAAVDAASGDDDDPSSPAPSSDPGATHAIRSPDRIAPSVEDAPPDEPPAPASKPAPRKDRRPSAPKPAPEPAPVAAAPDPGPVMDGFEAMLIDDMGEVQSEPFTEPAAFAAAYATMWDDTLPSQRDALAQMNADALEEARLHPEAQRILATLTAPSVAQTSVAQTKAPLAPPMVTIQPPVDRGRTSWGSWVRLFKEAMASVPDASFGMWAEVQQEVVRQAPIGQRALVIRALTDSAAVRRLLPPDWLAEALKPSKGEDAAESATPVEPSPPATIAQTADERWVENTERQLQTMNDAEAFESFVKSTAVQTLMRRLRRENPDLFDRANAAFSARYAAFNPPQEEDA